MAKYKYLVLIFIVLGLISPALIEANIRIYETPMDLLFNEFNIQLIKNSGSAYYLNLINNNANTIEFNSPENLATYLEDLKKTIDLAIADNRDEVIKRINDVLIPHTEQWIVNKAQKGIVVDLLRMQEFDSKYRVDYIGIPTTFDKKVNDGITGGSTLDFIKVKIHFSNCFTVQNVHIRDCSTVTISI